MGEVYAVLDESSGKKLALKRLMAGARERQEAAFEREYQTLAVLKHPHIVEVYDYVVEPAGSFYTMELLAGSDLSAQGLRPWHEVCRILRDVASILGLLHARRILHRDLSPKNIWCLPDGRIKLIDFGALTSFGEVNDVAGTPPFVPPEALSRKTLDQRSDLYALGALAYWLLTGAHAFSVRTLAELPAAWATAPVAPSQRLLARGAESIPPPELDGLIESLLQADPKFRTESAETLIEQLTAIADLSPDPNQRAGLDLLQNPQLVARARDLERIALSLRRAERHQGRALLVEAQRGLGRTRLLHELSVSARLFGITSLSANAAGGQQPFGVASALSLRLLEALPVQARKAAEPYLADLALVSEELRERLAVSRMPGTVNGAPFEQRMRISSALCDWFLSVSEAHTLSLFVDDIQRVDQESQAFLITLAHEARTHRLVLVASLPSDIALTAPLQTLRKLSKRAELKPLELADTKALLASIFGNAPYLPRLSERLHDETHGNPAHCLLLLEQLVRAGVVNYRDGFWALPQQLPDGALSLDWNGARAAQLQRLSAEGLAYLQRLSVARGSLQRGTCLALAGRSDPFATAALQELLDARLLIESGGRLSFAHAELRDLVEQGLEPAARAMAHRALGELLLARAQGDNLELLRAGLHLSLGGETKQSARLITNAAIYYGANDPSFMPAAAPLLEEALCLLRCRKVAAHQTMALEGALAVAGYYYDRRLARYGDSALHDLTHALHLHWVRVLRPVLGAKGALLLALATAAMCFALRPRDGSSPSFSATLLLLFYCASTLAGAGAVCIDSAASQRAADAIAPLAALGRNHVAALVHQFCSALAIQSRGNLHRSAQEWQRILKRLDGPRPRGMTEIMVLHYRAGALLAYGVKATWCDGPEALQIADQLSNLGLQLYEMSADQLRAGYYANQGKLHLFEQCKQRLDMHAIRRGTTWQVETWAPSTLMTSAQRLDDALLVKRSLIDLTRLGQQVESLLPYVERARGMYCAITRRYQDAIKLLDVEDPPQSYVAWVRTRGSLARALNGAGEHARARQVCLHALSHMDAEDRRYVAMNLTVQLELALAEAGLGNHPLAACQLDELLEQLGPDASDLTLFCAHEARTHVALSMNEEVAVQNHLARVQHHAHALALPTLQARAARLAKLAERSSGSQPESGPVDPSDSLATYLQKLLRDDHASQSLTSRADLTLSVAMELTRADRGLLVGSVSGSPALLAGGEHASTSLLCWIEERLALEARAALCTVTDSSSHPGDLSIAQLDGATYRVHPLWARRGDDDVLVGGLALGVTRGIPSTPPFQALQLMGSRLAELMDAETTEQIASVS